MDALADGGNLQLLSIISWVGIGFILGLIAGLAIKWKRK